jgi:hypothetical protein
VLDQLALDEVDELVRGHCVEFDPLAGLGVGVVVLVVEHESDLAIVGPVDLEPLGDRAPLALKRERLGLVAQVEIVDILKPQAEVDRPDGLFELVAPIRSREGLEDRKARHVEIVRT